MKSLGLKIAWIILFYSVINQCNAQCAVSKIKYNLQPEQPCVFDEIASEIQDGGSSRKEIVNSNHSPDERNEFSNNLEIYNNLRNEKGVEGYEAHNNLKIDDNDSENNYLNSQNDEACGRNDINPFNIDNNFKNCDNTRSPVIYNVNHNITYNSENNAYEFQIPAGVEVNDRHIDENCEDIELSINAKKHNVLDPRVTSYVFNVPKEREVSMASSSIDSSYISKNIPNTLYNDNSELDNNAYCPAQNNVGVCNYNIPVSTRNSNRDVVSDNIDDLIVNYNHGLENNLDKQYVFQIPAENVIYDDPLLFDRSIGDAAKIETYDNPLECENKRNKIEISPIFLLNKKVTENVDDSNSQRINVLSANQVDQLSNGITTSENKRINVVNIKEIVDNANFKNDENSSTFDEINFLEHDLNDTGSKIFGNICPCKSKASDEFTNNKINYNEEASNSDNTAEINLNNHIFKEHNTILDIASDNENGESNKPIANDILVHECDYNPSSDTYEFNIEKQTGVIFPSYNKRLKTKTYYLSENNGIEDNYEDFNVCDKEFNSNKGDPYSVIDHFPQTSVSASGTVFEDVKLSAIPGDFKEEINNDESTTSHIPALDLEGNQKETDNETSSSIVNEVVINTFANPCGCDPISDQTSIVSDGTFQDTSLKAVEANFDINKITENGINDNQNFVSEPKNSMKLDETEIINEKGHEDIQYSLSTDLTINEKNNKQNTNNNKIPYQKNSDCNENLPDVRKHETIPEINDGYRDFVSTSKTYNTGQVFFDIPNYEIDLNDNIATRSDKNYPCEKEVKINILHRDKNMKELIANDLEQVLIQDSQYAPGVYDAPIPNTIESPPISKVLDQTILKLNPESTTILASEKYPKSWNTPIIQQLTPYEISYPTPLLPTFYNFVPYKGPCHDKYHTKKYFIDSNKSKGSSLEVPISISPNDYNLSKPTSFGTDKYMSVAPFPFLSSSSSSFLNPTQLTPTYSVSNAIPSTYPNFNLATPTSYIPSLSTNKANDFSNLPTYPITGPDLTKSVSPLSGTVESDVSVSLSVNSKSIPCSANVPTKNFINPFNAIIASQNVPTMMYEPFVPTVKMTSKSVPSVYPSKSSVNLNFIPLNNYNSLSIPTLVKSPKMSPNIPNSVVNSYPTTSPSDFTSPIDQSTSINNPYETTTTFVPNSLASYQQLTEAPTQFISDTSNGNLNSIPTSSNIISPCTHGIGILPVTPLVSRISIQPSKMTIETPPYYLPSKLSFSDSANLKTNVCPANAIFFSPNPCKAFSSSAYSKSPSFLSSNVSPISRNADVFLSYPTNAVLVNPISEFSNKPNILPASSLFTQVQPLNEDTPNIESSVSIPNTIASPSTSFYSSNLGAAVESPPCFRTGSPSPKLASFIKSSNEYKNPDPSSNTMFSNAIPFSTSVYVNAVPNLNAIPYNGIPSSNRNAAYAIPPVSAGVTPYTTPVPAGVTPYTTSVPAGVTLYTTPVPAGVTPYTTSVPAGVTLYTTSVPAGVTPYTTPVPAGVTPYTTSVPAGVTPYTTSVPAGVTPYTTSVPAGVTPYTTPVPAGVTPYTTSVPAGVTPYATSVPAGVTPYTTPVPAGVTPYTTPAPAGVTPYTTSVPAGVTPYTTSVPAGVTPYTTSVPAGVTPYTTSVPAGVTPYTTSVPAGVTPYTTSVPAGVIPYTTPVSAGVTPYTTSVPTGIAPFTTSASTKVTAYTTSVPAGITPYTTSVPTGVNSYTTPVSAGVIPYITPVPAGVTPYKTSVPAEVTPYTTSVPTGVNSYTTSVPAGVTSYITPVPAGVTPYTTSVPAGVTPYTTSVPTGVNSYTTSVPAGVTSYITPVSAGVTSYTTSVPAGITPCTTPVRARVTPCSTLVSASTYPCTASVPFSAVPYTTSVSAGATSYTTPVPAGVTPYTTSGSTKAFPCATSVPVRSYPYAISIPTGAYPYAMSVPTKTYPCTASVPASIVPYSMPVPANAIPFSTSVPTCDIPYTTSVSSNIRPCGMSTPDKPVESYPCPEPVNVMPCTESIPFYPGSVPVSSTPFKVPSNSLFSSLNMASTSAYAYPSVKLYPPCSQVQIPNSIGATPAVTAYTWPLSTSNKYLEPKSVRAFPRIEPFAMSTYGPTSEPSLSWIGTTTKTNPGLMRGSCYTGPNMESSIDRILTPSYFCPTPSFYRSQSKLPFNFGPKTYPLNLSSISNRDSRISPSYFSPTVTSYSGPMTTSSCLGPMATPSYVGPTTTSSYLRPTTTAVSCQGSTTNQAIFSSMTGQSYLTPKTAASHVGQTISPSYVGPTTTPSYVATTSAYLVPTTNPIYPSSMAASTYRSLMTSQSPVGPTSSPSYFGPTKSPSYFSPTTVPTFTSSNDAPTNLRPISTQFYQSPMQIPTQNNPYPKPIQVLTTTGSTPNTPICVKTNLSPTPVSTSHPCIKPVPSRFFESQSASQPISLNYYSVTPTPISYSSLPAPVQTGSSTLFSYPIISPTQKPLPFSFSFTNDIPCLAQTKSYFLPSRLEPTASNSIPIDSAPKLTNINVNTILERPSFPCVKNVEPDFGSLNQFNIPNTLIDCNPNSYSMNNIKSSFTSPALKINDIETNTSIYNTISSYNNASPMTLSPTSSEVISTTYPCSASDLTSNFIPLLTLENPSSLYLTRNIAQEATLGSLENSFPILSSPEFLSFTSNIPKAMSLTTNSISEPKYFSPVRSYSPKYTTPSSNLAPSLATGSKSKSVCRPTTGSCRLNQNTPCNCIPQSTYVDPVRLYSCVSQPMSLPNVFEKDLSTLSTSPLTNFCPAPLNAPFVDIPVVQSFAIPSSTSVFSAPNTYYNQDTSNFKPRTSFTEPAYIKPFQKPSLPNLSFAVPTSASSDASITTDLYRLRNSASNNTPLPSSVTSIPMQYSPQDLTTSPQYFDESLPYFPNVPISNIADTSTTLPFLNAYKNLTSKRMPFAIIPSASPSISSLPSYIIPKDFTCQPKSTSTLPAFSPSVTNVMTESTLPCSDARTPTLYPPFCNPEEYFKNSLASTFIYSKTSPILPSQSSSSKYNVPLYESNNINSNMYEPSSSTMSMINSATINPPIQSTFLPNGPSTYSTSLSSPQMQTISSSPVTRPNSYYSKTPSASTVSSLSPGETKQNLIWSPQGTFSNFAPTVLPVAPQSYSTISNLPMKTTFTPAIETVFSMPISLNTVSTPLNIPPSSSPYYSYPRTIYSASETSPDTISPPLFSGPSETSNTIDAASSAFNQNNVYSVISPQCSNTLSSPAFSSPDEIPLTSLPLSMSSPYYFLESLNTLKSLNSAEPVSNSAFYQSDRQMYPINPNTISNYLTGPKNIYKPKIVESKCQYLSKILKSNINNALTPESLTNIANLSNTVIPLNEIGIVKYIPNKEKEIRVKTTSPGIELKAWPSRIVVLKPKLVLQATNFDVLNFQPVVKHDEFDLDAVQDIAKGVIETNYGKPLVVKGKLEDVKSFAIADIARGVDKPLILWPTYRDFTPPIVYRGVGGSG